jgi:membrane protease YdiL (CAAX protease family)
MLGLVYGPGFRNSQSTGLDWVRFVFWTNDLALPLNVASTLATLSLLSGARPYQLGLTSDHGVRHLLLAVITTICLVPVVYTILYLTNQFLKTVAGQSPEEHAVTRLILSHPPLIDHFVSGFAALIAAPLWEELLFRGIFQPWARTRSWGGYVGIAVSLCFALGQRWRYLEADWNKGGWHQAWPQLLPVAFVVLMVPGYVLIRAKAPPAAGAIYATALLFAAAHSSAWPSPVPLFFLAVALGVLRYRTQSLVPGIALHVLFNTVGWVMLFLQPAAPPPKNGNDATEARARVESISTSSAVPGSLLPRRT